MKDPTTIIIKPHITERSVALSYGDENGARKRLAVEARQETLKTGKKVEAKLPTEQDLSRKYTFIVNSDANKLEIKAAIESLYNAGRKKKEEMITVEKVHTVTIKGKKRRVGARTGYKPDRKKAIITLARGQMLEDYGV